MISCHRNTEYPPRFVILSVVEGSFNEVKWMIERASSKSLSQLANSAINQLTNLYN